MKWYVSIVGVHQEALAIRGLTAKSYECYCPIGTRTIRHARRQTIKTFPIFSRYIFVKFNINDPSYSDAIRSTDGVIDIISNNWLPMEVPEWVIEDIKQREKAGKFNFIPAKTKRYRWSRSFAVLQRLLDPNVAVQV